jgi:uncharacterized DUF497 family protein
MQIEFDPKKNEANIRDRGLSFELAAGVDFDSALIWQDKRKAYPEVRFSALGMLEGRLHAVVFTEAAKGIRVISFRKANKREERTYGKETKP